MHSRLPLELVLAMLNSKFADWYFRLGSTNNHVNHYQLTNIPSPRFSLDHSKALDEVLLAGIRQSLADSDFEQLRDTIMPLLRAEGASVTVQQVMSMLVQFIEEEESNRGAITRGERSHLAPDSEHAQEILDDMIFMVLGISEPQRRHIRDRLDQML